MFLGCTGATKADQMIEFASDNENPPIPSKNDPIPIYRPNFRHTAKHPLVEDLRRRILKTMLDDHCKPGSDTVSKDLTP